MSSTLMQDRSATRDEILAHRQRLRRLAVDGGLSGLQVDVLGTVIAHSDEPGYGAIKRFATAASAVVGAWVNVITDDVDAANVASSEL